MYTQCRSFKRISIAQNCLKSNKRVCFISQNNGNEKNDTLQKKNVVIVGGGIASMMSAYHLCEDYNVTILEEKDKLCQMSSKLNAGNICTSRVKMTHKFHTLPFRKFFENFDPSLFKLTKWGIMNFLYSYLYPKQYKNNKIYREIGQAALEAYENLIKTEKFDFINKKTDINYHFKSLESYEEELNYYKRLNLPYELNDLVENIDHFTKSKEEYREGTTQTDTLNYSVYPDQFNQKFEEILRRKGVEFKQNSKVTSIETINHQDNTSEADHVKLENGQKIHGDIFVVCSAKQDDMFQFSDVPFLPLTSLSWTLDATPERLAIYQHLPKNDQTIFVDSSTTIWYVRWFDKIRIVGGYWVIPKQKFIDKDWEKMKGGFQYPVEKEDATLCTRQISADMLPIISKHKNINNLYLNSVYGHLGWTLSSFGGQHLKNQIDGQVEHNFLSHERFTLTHFAKEKMNPTYKESSENQRMFD